jgi:hypothetical protein
MATGAGCHNYYHDPAGHNVTQWPAGDFTYALVTRLFARLGPRSARCATSSTPAVTPRSRTHGPCCDRLPPTNLTVNIVSKIVTVVCSAVFGILSAVLLVAQKDAAGLAFACAALVLALPLGLVVQNKRLLLWTRVVLVAALLSAAASSIAGTDLRPGQARTDHASVNKVLAIFEEFRDRLSGRNEEGGSHGQSVEESAFKFTQCLREQGLEDLPDPRITKDGFAIDFSRVKETPEEIRTAQNACDRILGGHPR